MSSRHENPAGRNSRDDGSPGDLLKSESLKRKTTTEAYYQQKKPSYKLQEGKIRYFEG